MELSSHPLTVCFIEKLSTSLISLSDVVVHLQRHLNFVDVFYAILLVPKCFCIMGLPETFDIGSYNEPSTHPH